MNWDLTYSHRQPTCFELFVLAVLDGKSADPIERTTPLTVFQCRQCFRIAMLLSSSAAVSELDWYLHAGDRTQTALDGCCSACTSTEYPQQELARQRLLEELHQERLSRVFSARRCAAIYLRYFLVGNLRSSYYDYEPDDKICATLITTWIAVACLASAISLAYPVIDAATNFAHLCMLQQIFLLGSGVCMGSVLLTIQALLDYIPFVLTQSEVLARNSFRNADNVRLTVARFHLPSVQEVLLREVPQHLVPRDVLVNIMLPLLGDDSDVIDMSLLTRQQCAEYQSRL
jgi:hypothetical protein